MRRTASRTGRQAAPEPDYYLTFRAVTGNGRLQARSGAELSRLLGELRLAGATDITVVDGEGRLVSFDPGLR